MAYLCKDNGLVKPLQDLQARDGPHPIEERWDHFSCQGGLSGIWSFKIIKFNADYQHIPIPSLSVLINPKLSHVRPNKSINSTRVII